MIKRKYLVLILIMALALTAFSCGIPQKDYDALQQQLAALQKDNEATRTQLTAAQNEAKNLQGQLASQTAALTQAQSQNTALQKQVSDLNTRLNAILDTKVTEYYNYLYQFVRYNWTLPIPLRSYFYYREQTRPTQYGPIVTDTNADAILSILIANIKDSILVNNLSQVAVINLVATFTQNLPHTNTDVATPYDTTPLYPLETLFQQGGDSADTSILAAALLKRLGYGVVLLAFDQQKHMAVGVNMPGAGGYSWEYQAVRYYYLETTGKQWQIGDCPPEYRSATPTIVPVGS